MTPHYPLPDAPAPWALHSDPREARAADGGSGGLQHVSVRPLLTWNSEIAARIRAHIPLYTHARYSVTAVEAIIAYNNGVGIPYIPEGADPATFPPLPFRRLLLDAGARQIPSRTSWATPDTWIPQCWWIKGQTGKGQFLVFDDESVIEARQCQDNHTHGWFGTRVLRLGEFLSLGYRYNSKAWVGGLTKRARETMDTQSHSLRSLLGPRPVARPDSSRVGG